MKTSKTSSKKPSATLKQNMRNWVWDRIENGERFAFGDFRSAMIDMGFDRQTVDILKAPMTALYQRALQAEVRAAERAAGWDASA